MPCSLLLSGNTGRGGAPPLPELEPRRRVRPPRAPCPPPSRPSLSLRRPPSTPVPPPSFDAARHRSARRTAGSWQCLRPRQLPSGGVHVIQDYSGNLREHQSQYFQAPIQAPIKVDCATSCTAHNEDISDGECGAIKVMQDRALSHGFDNVDGLGKQIQLIHEVKAYLEENFKLKVVYDNSTNT